MAVVGKPAQGRLARWATYLRSFVFDVRHIPGAQNLFCDLLSRNGCTTAILLYSRLHSQRSRLVHTSVTTSATPKGQYAIIMPAGIPPRKAKARRTRDLDITDNPLLPMAAALKITSRDIATEQAAAAIQSPTFIDVGGTHLYTNARGHVIVPAPVANHGGILDKLIVIAHQGDHHHRSSAETADVFMQTFCIHGHAPAATKAYITQRCRGCLGCIKLRTGGTIPRPLWFMVRDQAMGICACRLCRTAKGIQWHELAARGGRRS